MTSFNKFDHFNFILSIQIISQSLIAETVKNNKNEQCGDFNQVFNFKSLGKLQC